METKLDLAQMCLHRLRPPTFGVTSITTPNERVLVRALHHSRSVANDDGLGMSDGARRSRPARWADFTDGHVERSSYVQSDMSRSVGLPRSILTRKVRPENEFLRVRNCARPKTQSARPFRAGDGRVRPAGVPPIRECDGLYVRRKFCNALDDRNGGDTEALCQRVFVAVF